MAFLLGVNGVPVSFVDVGSSVSVSFEDNAVSVSFRDVGMSVSKVWVSTGFLSGASV